jgi:hypothetical protein
LKTSSRSNYHVSHIGSKAVQLADTFCFSKETYKEKYFVPTIIIKIFSLSVCLGVFPTSFLAIKRFVKQLEEELKPECCYLFKTTSRNSDKAFKMISSLSSIFLY